MDPPLIDFFGPLGFIPKTVICEHLRPVELVALQFQSDVWRSVARETLKNRLLEVNFSFENNPATPAERALVKFNIYTTKCQNSNFKIAFERPDACGNEQILSFGDDSKKEVLICKSASFEKLFENMHTLKNIIDSSYRSVELLNAWVAVDSELPRNLVLDFLTSSNEWKDVRMTKLGDELRAVPGKLVNKFLKVLKIQNKLVIALNSDEDVDFKLLPIRPPSAQFSCASWPTIEQIIDLNADVALFQNCAFTDDDMNTFLRRWMSGEAPNAKHYTFETNSRLFRSEHVLQGLKAERWSPERREKKYKFPILGQLNDYRYGYVDLSSEMDITRSDGVIGTLKFNVFQRSTTETQHNIHFYVWPEPFPMRAEIRRLNVCTEQFDRFLAQIDPRLLRLAQKAVERFWSVPALEHHDPELYEKLGAEGRKAVEAHLNKKHIGDSIQAFLR
ncbi:unnamed protein product [Caenorhabditis sp. 36 PRJEB53466]|nr:unnamed protein product [Caenorhabditis sp. 36 PRJEB53466]